MTDDPELLRRYAESGSEMAFTDFVVRHFGLVYAAARRRTGDDTRARDVAQRVFTEAARHAGTLAGHPSVAGWLYAATRNAALNLLRAERRRQSCEQAAAAMNAMTDPDGVEWERLRPVLDAAMDELSRSDRMAVLERYFESRPYAQIGARLRVSENTARMRVDRALDRLRHALVRRGVNSTAAALASVLAEQAVAAPGGLATGIAHAAVTAHLAGAAAAGWLTFFAMNKLTVGVVALVLVGALVPPVLELQAHHALFTERDRLNADIGALRAETTATEIAVRRAVAAAPDRAGWAELDHLQKRLAVLKARPAGVVDSQLRPPRNAGLATPEATFETMNWAIDNQDWVTFASTFVLQGETREKVAAFFAGVRPDIRARYGTPGGLLAHAWISGTTPHGSAWASAMQVIDSQLVDNGPATRRVRIWQRTGTGAELSNLAEFQYQPSAGWLISPGATAKAVRFILPQLDPETGEFVAKPAPK